jgi:hypothetical protein
MAFFTIRTSRTAAGRRSSLIMFLLIAFSVSTSICLACVDTDPAYCVPVAESCSGWSHADELRTAYNYEELTVIINGGASFYMGYGFVAAAFQNYAGEPLGTPTTVTLNLFNQGSPENALALYQDPESGSGDPVADWPGSGEARVRVAFGVITFQFREGCFFASLVMIPGDETVLDHVTCLATETMNLIQAETPVTLDSWGNIKRGFRP